MEQYETASKTGTPIMRPLFFDWPDDAGSQGETRLLISHFPNDKRWVLPRQARDKTYVRKTQHRSWAFRAAIDDQQMFGPDYLVRKTILC